MNGIWIRSQDKETLILATKVTIVQLNKYVIMANNSMAGGYDTKERAIEVINEIEYKLGYANDTEIRGQVYHMPKE